MDATIIAASLNSDELKKSIDSLVNYVKTGMGQIKSSVDSAVEGMQKSFNFKVDSSGGTSRVAKQQREVTQAVKDTEVAYDQLAQAQQKATAPKSARDSYLAFMQGYKQQAQQIQQQINSWESLLLQRQIGRIKEIDAQIARINQRVKEAELTSSPNRGQIIADARAKADAEIAQLRQLQQQLNNNPLMGQDTSYLDKLREKYDNVLGILREIGSTSRQNEQAQQTANAVVQQQETTEEQRISKIKEEWELEQKLHQEQGKRYDAQNEINRQLEIENSKTAENLAFQEKINAARAAKEGGVGKRVRETNELTGAIAGLLGIQEKEVAVTNVESASQNRLANYLNQLKAAYQKLDKEGMNASHGKMLADEIQRVSRAYAEMTKQMNRPTSLKNALGLDESTLDSIAYKMQQLNAYKRGLNLKTQQGEIEKVDANIKRLNDDLTKYMNTGRRVGELNNALARSWNYMKNRLAFYFTVGASTQFVKQLAEVRGEYEMTERALGVLVDSAQKGTQIFNELSQMALISPYTLIELSSAARQLTAYGVAAKDVVETTRRVADMAAAVGAPIERLTYALGHVQTYGYLTSLQARQFINAGIPIVKELSNLYTQMEGRMVSVADVYDRMKKKAVSYNDVMQVVNQMTDEGGRFFDFQAKMADTLKVQLANLDLAYKNMLNDIGKSTQGPIVWLIRGLKDLMIHWKEFNSTVRSTMATGLLVWLGAFFAHIKAIGTLPFWKMLLGGKLTNAFVGLGKAIKSAATSVVNHPWVAAFVLIASAIARIGVEAMETAAATRELNDAIATSSKESAQTMSELLKAENSAETRAKALGKQLSNEDGAKAWANIREQIENSSAAGSVFVKELLSIADINERVAESFNYAEKIEAASLKLADLKDYVKFSTDTLWGLFGEGIAEDLEDLQDRLDSYGGKWMRYFDAANDYKIDENRLEVNLQQDVYEASQEIKRFAEENSEVIRNALGDAISDPVMVKEAVARIVREFEMQNPKIRGAAKQFFEIQLDQEFAQQFEGVYDSTTTLWQMVLDRVKRDSSQTFSEITDDVIDDTNDIPEEYQKEIDKAFQNLKEELPPTMQTLLIQLQQQLNANPLQVKVGLAATFNAQMLDSLMKDYRDHFAPQNFVDVDGGKKRYALYTQYQKKYEESTLQWNQRLNAEYQSETENLNKQNQILGNISDKESVRYKEAEKSKQQSEERIAALQDVAKYEGFALELKGKQNKTAKNGNDEIATALTKEVSLVKKLQGEYDKLTKSVATHADALATIQSGFAGTIRELNAISKKYNLEKFDINTFRGKDPNKLLEFFSNLRQQIIDKGLGNLKRIETLDSVIQELTVTAKTYNLDKVTKGLNNELDKIKDEYELAVELDANPELGNMFTEMFGIDTADFPKTIDEFMSRAQKAFDKARFDLNLGAPLDIFKASDDDWYKWGEAVGYSGEQVDNFKKNFAGAVGVAKKWAQDVVNNTKKLEYELAELNDKIAIKEKEQARLHEQIENEKNEVTKHYLELTYQNNQKAIDELRSQALSLMPEYARVFNSIAEYSSGVSRRLQRDLMRVFDNAKYDSANKTWTLTGSDGKPTILNDTQYRKEREKLTREMRKSQAPFKKIKEAFKPSDENGVVDYAKGIELVSAEVQKLGRVASEIGNLAQIFGADEQTVEIINDVATSLDGVATAGQGVAQIASGDYIGGAASVLSGMASAISTWFDNSDKKISAQVKSSELAVKRLETTYKKLDYAIQEAYGAAVTGAKQAAIANKELQLVELQRQLRLEQSRDSKHYDEERVEDLRGQIIDLRNEIDASYKEIVNSLLGISSVGDAAESFMDVYINALRSGEDANEAFKESTQDMIANLIKKIYVTKVIGPQLEAIVDEMNERITNRSKSEAEAYRNAVEKYTKVETLDDEQLWWWAGYNDKPFGGTTPIEAARAIFEASGGLTGEELIDWLRNYYKEEVNKAKRSLDNASAATLEDIDFVAQGAANIIPALEATEDEIRALLDKYGLIKDTSDKTLSNLQQGIQGITEDTAGALEAYMNGVSQQVYLQSDLLTQIRDAIVGFDLDVQVSVMSQMLLQLQSSYQVQQSILTTMQGWSNASGMALRVEMI